MAELATIATIAATVITAAGTLAAGNAAANASEFQAKQYDMKAQEERASAQREALQQRQQTQLLQSRGQAVAGASGFGALDPTVRELAGDVEQGGAYREAMIRYGGEERARGLTDQAAASRMSGDAARTGSYFDAAGTLAGGFARTFAGKYGGTGPEDAPLDLLKQRGGGSFFYGSSGGYG